MNGVVTYHFESVSVNAEVRAFSQSVRCMIVSGSLLQNLHAVLLSFFIFVLKVLRLLCPVIISVSNLRSGLESFRICLLYFGSTLGKKIFVCLNLLESACHCSIHSA